jgi:hypothetical protein
MIIGQLGDVAGIRNRVLKLSSSYRNPMVKHEPDRTQA